MPTEGALLYFTTAGKSCTHFCSFLNTREHRHSVHIVGMIHEDACVVVQSAVVGVGGHCNEPKLRFLTAPSLNASK